MGFTSLEVEALEKDYGNLCQAISAAEVIQKNYGGGADKVYLTGKAWDNDVKQFQVTKYGMKDYNASDFIIKKGNSFLGVSLKKKISATTADPTLINKGFSTMIQGSFGRLTGYDDNGDSICYTNIQSLQNYVKLWDNNMDFKTGTATALTLAGTGQHATFAGNVSGSST